jgi:hypothetical protein
LNKLPGLQLANCKALLVGIDATHADGVYAQLVDYAADEGCAFNETHVFLRTLKVLKKIASTEVPEDAWKSKESIVQLFGDYSQLWNECLVSYADYGIQNPVSLRSTMETTMALQLQKVVEESDLLRQKGSTFYKTYGSLWQLLDDGNEAEAKKAVPNKKADSKEEVDKLTSTVSEAQEIHQQQHDLDDVITTVLPWLNEGCLINITHPADLAKAVKDLKEIRTKEPTTKSMAKAIAAVFITDVLVNPEEDISKHIRRFYSFGTSQLYLTKKEYPLHVKTVFDKMQKDHFEPNGFQGLVKASD